MHIFNKLNLLVVEDDEPKLNAISSFIKDNIENCEILEAKSLASAVKLIANQKLDLAILDMSLPAYDLQNDMTGSGQPQDYGGRDLLRFLEDEKPHCKAVVVTQYSEFGTKGNLKKLEPFARELQNEFGSLLLEVIYYSGQRGEWRDKLLTHLKNIKND